ncbi:MAG: hypothetical protein J6S26_00195 [Solobacterium sp.]|nr:hypothetical protein [Solobacterium sp.]
MQILPQDDSARAHIRTALSVLSCILSALPFYGYDPRLINYTGLFHERPFVTFACLLIPLCVMTYRFELAWRTYLQEGRKELWFMLGMILVLLVIPYHPEEDFFSGLHVLMGFLVFLNLNRLFFKLYVFHPSAFSFYLGGTVFAFFTALLTFNINGWSELVYAFVLNIFLDLLSRR